MKVLLIDDHPLILQALQSVIEGLGSDTTVVGANSARAARETLKAASDFDLVLLDLHLGEAVGIAEVQFAPPTRRCRWSWSRPRTAAAM
jgi:CheY-like chemotaxis protein